MCSLLESCIRIMIVFLAVIILKIFFDIFFRPRKLNIIIFINWICYIIWQVILSKNNALPGYVNIAISIFLMSIICIFAYEGSFLQKIVFSLLINVMWMLIEFLVGYIFVVCEIHIYYRIPQVVGLLVSKLLMLILILVLRRFFINENIITIPNKYHMLLLTIPIGSMFVVYNIFAICLLTNNKKYIGVSFASSILVLAINIIMFRLYMILSKEKELQKFNTVYEQQLELCNQHMREKESVMMSARNIKHDIKQHFIVLIELLDKNENDVAISYLKKLIDMNILNSDGICKSGNIVVDSLINAKYTVASNLKIKFDIDIHIPIQLSFESADISILLGNILDNAIEASLKIDEGKRHIRLFMKYDCNTLIITVINTFIGDLNKNKDGRILTSKDNPFNHGIGLESVRKVARKYRGSVIIETKDDCFIIKIAMCDLSEKLQVTL